MTMRVYALYHDHSRRFLIVLLAFILAALIIGCVRMLPYWTSDV